MLIEDIIGTSVGLGVREIQTIKAECSQFLKESAGLPLLKSLPTSYNNFHKVKVRLQKRKDDVAEAFDKAFGNQFVNLRQRAVFAYPSTPPINEGTEPFYVFPINGYKFLYSKEVTNSSSDYKRVIDTLFEQFDDSQKATEIVTDLLKYTYSTDNLHEGIVSDSEVILYGIPFYYAIRVSACQGYGKLLSNTHTK